MITLFQKCQKILEERRQKYKETINVHARAAELWGGYIRQDLSITDVLVMMALFKIARYKIDKNEDSLIDGINYLALIDPQTDKDLEGI